jgi:DNA-directed RNA polymerase specialized sigma24 family protein
MTRAGNARPAKVLASNVRLFMTTSVCTPPKKSRFFHAIDRNEASTRHTSSMRASNTQRPEPSAALLELLMRRAMSRGIPPQEAEDIVVSAYHKVAKRFDPSRGSFESLYMATIDNDCRFYWRSQERQRKRHLRLVEQNRMQRKPSTAGAELADRHQQALIDAFTEEEREVFALWALQKHLPRGTLKALDAASALGVSVAEWENAKRRLRARIGKLLDDWGMAPRDFFSLEDDERPKRAKR